MGSPTGMVPHSCGELNPAAARFCGGCGADMAEGKACAACGHVGTPGARFCQACGERLRSAGADLPENAAVAGRMGAVEAELASMREDMRSLLELKEQLDAALKRVRQRQGGSGAGSSRPSAPKPAAARPASDPTAPASEASVPVEGGAEVEPADAPAEIGSRSLAIIHFDERPDLQDAVQAAVAPYTVAHYHTESVLAEGMPEGLPFAVVNLMSGDPLAAFTSPELRLGDARYFTYATDGTRGFVLGVTEIFSPPFDADACATRILAVLPAAPRVLLVSEAVLGTPELRAHLVRQGCTTSVAFDERQALGIIPSVRPNLVLIDLNLPRGEGLRLAARIRADHSNNHVRIAFLWQQAIEPALFRQFVGRAIHDFQFRDDDLKRALLQEFNPGGAATVPGR